MNIKLATKPESNLALLKRSFTLYRHTLWHVFGFAVLFTAIIFSPRLLVYLYGPEVLIITHYFSVSHFLAFLINILGVFVFLAILWRMHCVLIHKHESITDDLTKAAKKIFFIICAGLVQNIVIVGLTLLVLFCYKMLITDPEGVLNLTSMILLALVSMLYIIAILSVFVFFFFYIVIILTEDSGVIAPLMKSAFLVWNNVWRVLLLQFIPIVGYFGLLYVIKSFLFSDIHFYLVEPMVLQEPALPAIIHFLILTLFVPFFAAVLLVQLRDLELRKHV